MFYWETDDQTEALEDYKNTPNEQVLDFYGNPVAVPCDECAYSYVVYDSGRYICPTCGKVVSRKYVFDWAGLRYFSECLICSSNLGNCITCPFGHLDDL